MKRKIHLGVVFGSVVLLALAVIGLQMGRLGARANNDSADVQKRNRQNLMVNLARLPISFEANIGQTESSVRFLSRGQGYTLFLTANAEAVLALSKSAHSPVRPGDALPSIIKARAEAAPTAVLNMKLENAKLTPQLEGVEELPGKVNYFIGNDSKKWRTNVPIFGKVKVHDVYPGVDLVYYGNQRQLEQDFIVAPGSDPRAITMSFMGAETVSLNAEGDLLLAMKDGEMRLQKPVVYQVIEGVRREIPGTYQLKSAHQVSFQVASYDESRTLIIDPVVVYATYLGGNDYDIALGVAADTAGNAYVTGYTDSANFPTTPGAFQTTFTGGPNHPNAFVTKLNPTLSGLVYSTYLGGNGGSGEIGTGIAIDASGNAYVAGTTSSASFPTTPGVVQPTYNGGGDLFVTKLNATGNALLYSTYLGGSGSDSSSAIAVDIAGDAYITGNTNSTDFPTTVGAFQTTYGGGPLDAFVTKLNPTASAPLAYSTYLGGTGDDIGYALAVDATGSAYVAGFSASANFPTTAGAFQTTLNGTVDAYVTKLNPSGSAPVYSTYLGGSGSDAAQGVAVDSLGNAYVSGSTDSTDFPTTAGAFQTTFGGTVDAFVTKLNPIGSAAVYSTYLGGPGYDVGYNVAVDTVGNAYVTGYADVGFPTTPGAFQTTFGGGASDAFVTKLNPTGSAPLLYSTLIGGSANDGGQWLAVDPFGNAYLAGFTFSPNFPATPGAFQVTYGGGALALSDGIVVKLITGTLPPRVYVANSGSNNVSVIDPATNSVVATIPVGAGPDYSAVTVDGTQAYVANGGANSVSVINTATNTVTATVAVGSAPAALAITPDGGKVYVTNTGGNSVSVISTASNSVVATVSVGSGPFDIAITPDGTKAYVANALGGSVSVINTATDTVMATVAVGLVPLDVVIAPNGTSAYVANALSNSVSVVNTATDAVAVTVRVGRTPVDIAVTPDGTKAYVTNSAGNSVSVISTATNTVLATTRVGRTPNDVAVSQDGSKVFVTNNASNSASIISTLTNTVIATVPVGGGPNDVAVTTDGTEVFVTNGTTNSASVIGAASNSLIATVPVGTTPVNVATH